MLKLVFWLAVGLLAYRFWYVPQQLKSGEPNIPQEEDDGGFAEYEEVE